MLDNIDVNSTLVVRGATDASWSSDSGEATNPYTVDQFGQLVHPYISNVRARSYGNAIKFWIGV